VRSGLNISYIRASNMRPSYYIGQRWLVTETAAISETHETSSDIECTPGEASAVNDAASSDPFLLDRGDGLRSVCLTHAQDRRADRTTTWTATRST
jgi:hypothetical protein